MDAKNAIDEILHNATGRRASGRELLVTEKKSILDPQIGNVLKEQWQSAGRDHARVMMMLSEEDGSNPHFVTGWDGKDTFVCYTESGLTYIDYRKLEQFKVYEEWDPQIRLIELRAHRLTEAEGDGLSGPEVDMLLDRIKKTLKKSSKGRRKGRLRNMEKFFSFAVVESKGILGGTVAESNTESDSDTEFEKIDEKDKRAPTVAPKEPKTTKLPKTAAESFHWDVMDQDGRPRRRPLRHPWMEANSTDPQMDKREHVRMDSEGKGGGGGATPGGNKTDAQKDKRELIDVRHEDAQDAQMDKREHVRQDSEGKGGGGGATPGGNKTDAQKDKRELIDVRHEEFNAKDSSDKSDDADFTIYSGEKAKNKEFASRPKIAVRHEAMGDKKAKELFGPGSPKKAPMAAKKPLLMLVLMAKGKKGPKRPMAEAATRVCRGCRSEMPVGPGPKGMMTGLSKTCPSCEAQRAKTGGGLTIKMPFGMPGKPKRPKPPTPPASTFESRRGRSRLKLIESKKGAPESFLANIKKMKAKAAARKKGSKGCY